jgi:hypothetical protein
MGGRPSHLGFMRAWSTSAINSYYLDPVITFVAAGHLESRGKLVAIAGYYVTPHCEPDCCEAFGDVSRVDIGPFRSASQARRWSRANLAEDR